MSFIGELAMKHFVVLKTKLAGMPYNIRVETTADSFAVARNNAMFFLKKYGHAVFHVNPRAFKPSFTAFLDLLHRNPTDAVAQVDTESQEWERSVNIRAFIKDKQ